MICKAFANGSIANIKFSKFQLSKMIQLREYPLKCMLHPHSHKINDKI